MFLIYEWGINTHFKHVFEQMVESESCDICGAPGSDLFFGHLFASSACFVGFGLFCLRKFYVTCFLRQATTVNHVYN